MSADGLGVRRDGREAKGDCTADSVGPPAALSLSGTPTPVSIGHSLVRTIALSQKDLTHQEPPMTAPPITDRGS